MRSDTRQMHLMATIAGFGHHPAGWRASALAAKPGLPPYAALARIAEGALFDAVLFGPATGSPRFLLSGAADALQVDPLPIISTLIARTRHVGLGASAYVDRSEPFHIARAFAVSDRLARGRTAWLADLVGTDHQAADYAHGQPPRSSAERYERAAEFIDVVTQLWDSWEDDAIVADKATSLFADASKIHPINHRGKWFQVRGPLTAIRPIQGRPVIVMRDSSPEGIALAASAADVFLASGTDRAAIDTLAAEARALAGGRDLRILASVTPLLAPTMEAAQQRAAALDTLVDAPLALALVAEDWGLAIEAGKRTAAELMAAPLDSLCGDLPHPAKGMTLGEAGRHLASTRNGLRFVGTPDAFCDLLAEWHGTGTCDGFNIQPSVLSDDLALMAESVVPGLQARGLFRTAYPGSTLRDSLGLPRPPSQFAAA